MALYADENFPLRVVEELRRLGQDVITALEDGKANQAVTDQELLTRATDLDRSVLTLNRLDFKRLHVQNPDHAGIIICTEDPDRVGQAQRILAAIAKASGLRGQLIRVYRPDRSHPTYWSILNHVEKNSLPCSSSHCYFSYFNQCANNAADP